VGHSVADFRMFRSERPPARRCCAPPARVPGPRTVVLGGGIGEGRRGPLRRRGECAAIRRIVWAAVLIAGLGVTAGPRVVAQDQKPKKLNPFTGKTEAIQQGRTLYLQYGCSGCHGVGGGGGMAMPLIDDVWKFGGDDETLFKLIKGQIPEATMPKVWGFVPDEEVWKMLAYVRSLYSGDPSRVVW
jgi:mono/diheme cytochrome c family protein